MFQLKELAKLVLLTVFLSGYLFADDEVQSTKSIELEQFKEAQTCYSNSVEYELWKAGLACAKRSLDLGHKLFSPEHKSIAGLTHNYGLMLARNKKHSKAVNQFEKTYTLYKKHYGRKSTTVGWLLIDLANSQVKENAQQAVKNYQKGLDILSIQESFDSLTKAEISLKASIHLSGSGRSSSHTLKKALKMTQFAYETYLKAYDESHYETALAAFTIGKISYLKRDYEIAVKFLEKSLVNQNIGKYAHGILVDLYTKKWSI